jgi:AsmA protein
MRGESTAVKATLRGENMPAQDLEALLPAIGVTLPKGSSIEGGSLNAAFATEGTIEKLVTTGNLSISNIRLAGFDLGSKMAAVASLAGIRPSSVTEIEKFISDLRLSAEGIQASNLVMIVPTLGQLTGNGTVGSSFALDFKMQARLNSAGGVVGSLTRLAGVNAGNEINVPFFIRGTASNPTFVPDAKGLAGSILESAISGKGAKSVDNSQGQSLGDTQRGLFKKPKK